MPTYAGFLCIRSQITYALFILSDYTPLPKNNKSLVVGEDLNQSNGLVEFSERFTHFLELAIDDTI